MNTKKLIWIVPLALLGGIVIWLLFFFLSPVAKIQPIYLVPKDAVYIIETEEPIEEWKDIKESEVWNHLSKNDYFKELTSNADYFDSLINSNRKIFDLLGSRSVVVSAHEHRPKEYEYLYLVDLKKVTKLQQVNDFIGQIVSGDYRITRRNYHDKEILELYDKEDRETIYLYFHENLLAASYTHILIEQSIDQLAEPVIGRDVNFLDINKAVGYDGKFRVYLHYNYFSSYLKGYFDVDNEYITSLCDSWKYTGLTFDINDESLLEFTGYSNSMDSKNSFLKALQNSGSSKLNCFDVAPLRTAFILSMGFEDFSTIHENYENGLKENNEYAEYKEGIDKIEKLLKISIKDDFISWIDGEIAFIQTKPNRLGADNEFAVLLKAKSDEMADTKLAFLREQIKKKTPVKIKQISYKGYPINYLSLKGFFKLILGKFFGKLEKPYYVIIDDFVVFSNHPQTLRGIIDDYIDEKTLSNSDNFKDFYKNFDNRSTFFAYVNSPFLYENVRSFVNDETWSSVEKNKEYITCFPHMGLQLTNDKSLFETNVFMQFVLPKEEITSKKTVETKKTLIVEKPVDPLEFVDQIIPNDLDANAFRVNFESTDDIFAQVELKNGVRHGNFRAYHSNGKLRTKGSFQNDKKDGIWRIYDLNGKVIEKIKYDRGERVD